MLRQPCLTRALFTASNSRRPPGTRSRSASPTWTSLAVACCLAMASSAGAAPSFAVNQTITGAATGLAWGDANHDGWQDFIVLSPSGSSYYYENYLGMVGGFGSITNSMDPTSAAWGDYDGDGLLDIVAVGNIGAVGLTLSRYQGVTLVDVTSSVFAGSEPSQCRGVGWADFDRDGDLDLCVARQGGSGSSLFVNQGGASIVDGDGLATGTSVAWGDYDDDRWPDLYLGDLHVGSATSGHLYHNVAGTLVDVTTSVLGNPGGKAYHAEWVDYDSDGRLDLYVANTTPAGSLTGRLFHNGDGTPAGFTDVTASSGIVADGRTAAWADYDNDGYIDLYARHSTGNRVWRNVGGGTFINSTPGALGVIADGGIGWADVDNDGDLDVAVSHSAGPTTIFRNDGPTGHWLHVDLIGTQLNRIGVGARIQVKTGPLVQTREVSASSGYLGENSITAEFGLGLASVIDSLIVTWPDGKRQSVIPPPAVDRKVLINELTGPTGVEDGRTLPFALRGGAPNPFSRSTVLPYELMRAGTVNLEVFDLGGRRVRRLVEGSLPAGVHQSTWDGADDAGRRLPAGVYLSTLRTGGRTATQRIVLLP